MFLLYLCAIDGGIGALGTLASTNFVSCSKRLTSHNRNVSYIIVPHSFEYISSVITLCIIGWCLIIVPGI